MSAALPARGPRPPLDVAAVRHLERLAVLALPEGARQEVVSQLEAMVLAVDQLAAIDVEGVAPMFHPALPLAPPRADEAEAPLSPDALLATCPGLRDGYIAVPLVLEG